MGAERRMNRHGNSHRLHPADPDINSGRQREDNQELHTKLKTYHGRAFVPRTEQTTDCPIQEVKINLSQGLSL